MDAMAIAENLHLSGLTAFWPRSVVLVAPTSTSARRALFRPEIDIGGTVTPIISTNMATLETAGAEFRAAEALALRAHGLTIEAIAELFGVTRQRISALLKQKAAIQIDMKQ